MKFPCPSKSQKLSIRFFLNPMKSHEQSLLSMLKSSFVELGSRHQVLQLSEVVQRVVQSQAR
jgi:hypothetical protein